MISQHGKSRPAGCWVEERVKKEALLYSSRSEFKRRSGGAFNAAKRLKILDDVCSHMKRVNNPPSIYTEVYLANIALKYTSKKDFRKNDLAAWKAAYRRGLVPLVCSHMEELCKPTNFWNYEECKKEVSNYKTLKELYQNNPTVHKKIINENWSDLLFHLKRNKASNGTWCDYSNIREEALKYKSRSEFKKNSNGAYSGARKLNVLDDVCSHMEPLRDNYKHIKDCARVALNFNNRVVFREEEPACYDYAQKRGWLDEICEHMEYKGNTKKRKLYAIEFEDECVYVGLTFDYEDRERRRKIQRDYVWEKQQSVNYKTVYFNVLYPAQEASKKERALVEQYKQNGWTIINRKLAGGLGGNSVKWTEDKIFEVALKCSSRGELWKKYPGAAARAKKVNTYEVICAHMG